MNCPCRLRRMDIYSALLILKIFLIAALFGGLVFLFFAVFSIYTNLSSGVPWAKMPLDNIDQIFKNTNLKKGSLVYDLGCGDGRVLFRLEKLGYRGRGYELSLYPFLRAVFKKYFIGSRIGFKRANFFKEDLSQADAFFIFLVGKVMPRVGEKLGAELKKGALVLSYCFAIPGWQAEKIIETKPSLTYVYRI